MKQNPVLISAYILAVFLAGAMTWRIQARHSGFDSMVRESLKTSEGYDQKFLELVDHLEEILTTRASFGYTGEKDPMTGKIRQIVKTEQAKTKKKKSPEAPEEQEDPVRLTAIIAADNASDFTAIVMDGERSQAVSVGDRVIDRRVIEITAQAVIMEDDSLLYRYDISGKKFKRARGPAGE